MITVGEIKDNSLCWHYRICNLILPPMLSNLISNESAQKFHVTDPLLSIRKSSENLQMPERCWWRRGVDFEGYFIFSMIIFKDRLYRRSDQDFVTLF